MTIYRVTTRRRASRFGKALPLTSRQRGCLCETPVTLMMRSIPDEVRSPFIVVGNVDREDDCLDKRSEIDRAKASSQPLMA